MKKFVMSLALSILFVLGVNAQSKGDFYVGTGNIANKAWTEWSVAPTVGYGITDNLKLGVGKMLMLHRGVYIDPKVVYDVNAKTTNLMLGIGFRFCK